MTQQRLTIAIQKKGRLNNQSLELLARCGLQPQLRPNALVCQCKNLPIDLLLVRSCDIPTLVANGSCDLGIVGQNTLQEKQNNMPVLQPLGFGRCRLSIATLKGSGYQNAQDLAGKRIATSYTSLLQSYLQQRKIDASILPLSGSVEIAPRLAMADAICDLVATGQTLADNDLQEIITLMRSEAVLIQTPSSLPKEKEETIALLLRRMDTALNSTAARMN
jgi:ATP phosphoribosyltransferase